MTRTSIEQTTRNGQAAIAIKCDCATHPAGANSAVIVGAAGPAVQALKGKAQRDRIHGLIVMANHPAKMISGAAARDGIHAN
jgi:hypothetical protein